MPVLDFLAEFARSKWSGAAKFYKKELRLLFLQFFGSLLLNRYLLPFASICYF